MGRLASVFVVTLALAAAGCSSAPAGTAASSPAKDPGITGKPPLQVVATAPKGTLHNPYNGNAQMATEGHKLFFQYGCNGCHGGGGGGGMCPPLINGVWIYGGDDDTLFRLVSLGSQKLQAAGYTVQALENVSGPMPSMGPLIKSDGDLWKIITWIRSAYIGPPEHKDK
ncbi:MAG TPA: c-type cytochrome [Steroidobacteraceae bacterium]|nr:c-type cytochrome [Steroidobacteraceae bacterium]